jgi:imidazolonepropionase-like amidohydrolase
MTSDHLFQLPGGLVDAHAHLSLDFSKTGLARGSAALIRINKNKQLHSGVLALRDAGQVPGAVWDGDSSLHVIRSGHLLAPEGRYHAGLYLPTSADELIPAALQEIEHGAQWVKIIADFPGSDGNWFKPIVNYPLEHIQQLVKEVHAAGARVMAHVSGSFVVELVRAGVDSIEHGPEVTTSLVKEMAEHGTAWVPTLWTVHRAITPLANLDNPVGAKAREVIGRWRETLPLAVQLGVPVLAGSDEAPHGSLYLEIQKLHEFGLTPAQALEAASSVPRRYFNLPDPTDDYVLYTYDPRQDLSVLAQPAKIVVKGRVVALEPNISTHSPL